MVLLFDIDGTLLQSHGVGRRAIEASLADQFGRAFDTSSVPFSGKTDRQIFRQILALVAEQGTEVDNPDAAAERFGAAYAERMHAALVDAHVEALPGALDLVRGLAADGAEVGLLTGNLEPLAYAKVGRIALGRTEFPFGAFGSDDEDRDALPAVAVERAAAHLGRAVDPAEVVVIGDTPLDVACARAGGCVAVAVATGRFSPDELDEADVVLDTLEDFRLADVEAAVARAVARAVA